MAEQKPPERAPGEFVRETEFKHELAPNQQRVMSAMERWAERVAQGKDRKRRRRYGR